MSHSRSASELLDLHLHPLLAPQPSVSTLSSVHFKAAIITVFILAMGIMSMCHACSNQPAEMHQAAVCCEL